MRWHYEPYGIQVILNIAVVTNTIPNTGITLPFISYGLSSLTGSMMGIGLVLKVHSEDEKKINPGGEGYEYRFDCPRQ